MAAKQKFPPKKMAVKKNDQMMYLYVLTILMKFQTHYMNNTKVILNYVPCSLFCIIFGFLAVFQIFFQNLMAAKSDPNPPSHFFWTKTLLNVHSLNNT
jgi:uncharacterized membrane protein